MFPSLQSSFCTGLSALSGQGPCARCPHLCPRFQERGQKAGGGIQEARGMARAFSAYALSEGPAASQALPDPLVFFLCFFLFCPPVPWNPNSLLCSVLFEEERDKRWRGVPSSLWTCFLFTETRLLAVASPKASSAKISDLEVGPSVGSRGGRLRVGAESWPGWLVCPVAQASGQGGCVPGCRDADPTLTHTGRVALPRGLFVFTAENSFHPWDLRSTHLSFCWPPPGKPFHSQSCSYQFVRLAWVPAAHSRHTRRRELAEIL